MRSACLAVVLTALCTAWPRAAAQESPAAVFRSSVNLVSMAAIVRDAKGRVVSSLTRDDFQVTDGGQPKPLLDVRTEAAAPASVALLVDGSGSMKVSRSAEAALRVSNAVLDSLDWRRDDAALFSFDTRLITIRDFTHDLWKVRESLGQVESWGSTSLFDAIAGTADAVAGRARHRRAIVVLTDGADTTSSYAPSEVAGIASALDAPVYVILWDPRAAATRSAVESARLASLGVLTDATGGTLFVVGDDATMAKAITTLVEELRHQYVLAFEAATDGGWRSIRVQTHRRGLSVRTRAWYRTTPAGE